MAFTTTIILIIFTIYITISNASKCSVIPTNKKLLKCKSHSSHHRINNPNSRIIAHQTLLQKHSPSPTPSPFVQQNLNSVLNSAPIKNHVNSIQLRPKPSTTKPILQKTPISIKENYSSSANKTYIVGAIDQKFANDCLSTHNKVRLNDPDAPSSIPLEWSESLAIAAQKHANYLRDIGKTSYNKLRHSDFQFGENLAWVKNGDNSCSSSVMSWYNEKKFYTAGTIVPNDTPDGNPFNTYGHFTQVIWKSTTKIGCAYADNDDERYIVCEYSSRGNIQGQPAY